MNQRSLLRMTVSALLKLHADTLDELRKRRVIRSSNNPCADYAEQLICRGLALKSVEMSKKGYDAIDRAGKKYEIKARRVTPHSKPTRFSAVRDLPGKHFDFLVAVLFSHDFEVIRAAVFTRGAVRKRAFYQKHVNGWILPLTDELWTVNGAKDITTKLRRIQSNDGV